MFFDPAGVVELDPPPDWAFDPVASSLTHLVFRNWATRDAQRLHVTAHRDLRVLGPGASDAEWERAVHANLPPDVVRAERHRGPVVLAERLPAGASTGSRLAWVRGLRFGAMIEHHAVPPGGVLATPELSHALRTLRLPVEREGIAETARDELKEVSDAAAGAMTAGDDENTMRLLERTRALGRAVWLRSLTVEGRRPDFRAVWALANAATAIAARTRSIPVLRDATTMLYRCRASLHADFVFRTPLHDDVDALIATVLQLHASLAGSAVPTNAVEAAEIRCQLAVNEVSTVSGAPWMTDAILATVAWQDATTAAPFIEQIAGLDRIAQAGEAICAVTLGPVSVSVRAMRESAFRAVRRLASLAPSALRYRRLVNVVNGYAMALAELGDDASLAEAQAAFAETRPALAVLGEQDPLYAMTATNEACLRYAQGQTKAGLAAADRAIALARAAKVKATEATGRACRSRLLAREGRFEEALAEAKLAAELMGGEPTTNVRMCLATAYQATGNTAAAVAELQAALASELVANPVSDAVQDLLDTAAAVSPATSLEAAEAAAILFDLRRQDVGTVAERTAYDDAARRRAQAAALVERRVAARELLAAVAAADGARARSLVDVSPDIGPERGVRVDAPPRDAPLSNQIAFVAAASRALLKCWGVPPALGAEDLPEIVAGHGRTIVLFHPVENRLLAFVIAPDDPRAPRVVRVASTLSDVAGLTDALRQRIQLLVAARAAGIDMRSDGELARLSRTLHDALFSAVARVLPEGSPLTLVPYRELAFVPFALLTDARGRSLADRHSICVAPSLASLRALKARATGPYRAVVVGDPALSPSLGLPPLSGAAAEAKDVQSMLTAAGIETTPLFAADATEPAFRAAVSGAHVVHVASHAALREPVSASALFLAPSPHDDGLLIPAEIVELNLDGALVVLSACQSGLGKATADGILGLGRAFMRAGARTLVLASWRVADDTTAFLMKRFYEALLGSPAPSGRAAPLDVAAALQVAQRATRDGTNVDPVDWGGWIVLGDGAFCVPPAATA